MRIRLLMELALLGLVVNGLSACANKGKLKSPSQMEAEQRKAEKRASKKTGNDAAADNATADEKTSVANPAAYIPPAGKIGGSAAPDIVASPSLPDQKVNSDEDTTTPLSPLALPGGK